MGHNVVVDRLSRRAGMRIVPGRALSAGSVSFVLLERAFGRAHAGQRKRIGAESGKDRHRATPRRE